MAKLLTYNEQFRSAVKELTRAGIERASREAQLLLCAACGEDGTFLMISGDELMPSAQSEIYKQFVARRACHEPSAYITEKKDFWAISCFVNEHVLIPRPETEGVVEQGLELLKGKKAPRILDVGTGSGAIIISLLTERQDAQGVGVDISEPALKTAAKNAQANGVDKRCAWRKSNFLNGVTGAYDLIVSNPPYIDDKAMLALPKNVQDYEPHLALSGGADGLTAYRAIIAGLKDVLKPGGHIVFEIGYDQARSVKGLLEQAGLLDIEVKQDLAGHDRVVSAKMFGF